MMEREIFLYAALISTFYISALMYAELKNIYLKMKKKVEALKLCRKILSPLPYFYWIYF